MSYELIAILIFTSMMLMLLTGQRVFGAIGGVATAFALMLWGKGAAEMPFNAAFALLNWYPLLTLPLFIYMGYMFSESGIASDLYRMFHVWMGSVSGGLAIGTMGLMVAGIAPENVRLISSMAMIPTWFLAIYTMIVLLAPSAHAAWRRWGFTSLVVLVGLACAADWAYFKLGWTFLGWTNYFWVWLAVHHLGFAWRDARLRRPQLLVVIAVCALLLLLVMVLAGPYPVAMAGSPGEEVSNSLPPKVTDHPNDTKTYPSGARTGPINQIAPCGLPSRRGPSARSRVIGSQT